MDCLSSAVITPSDVGRAAPRVWGARLFFQWPGGEPRSLQPSVIRYSKHLHARAKALLRRIQEPDDRIIVQGKLDFFLTLTDLSASDAQMICAGMAKVLERLIPRDLSETLAVRGYGGMVFDLGSPDMIFKEELSQFLDNEGTSALMAPLSDTQIIPAPDPAIEPQGLLRETASAFGNRGRFLAVLRELKQAGGALATRLNWNTQQDLCGSLLVETRHETPTSTREGVSDLAILSVKAADAISHILSDEGRVVGLIIPVLYDDLGCLRGRVAFLMTLKKAQSSTNTPPMIRVTNIPGGAASSWLAELMSVLHAAHAGVALEFKDALPDSHGCFGADALGQLGPLDRVSVKYLAALCSQQRVLSFMSHTSSLRALHVTRGSGVQFVDDSAVATPRHPNQLFHLPLLELKKKEGANA